MRHATPPRISTGYSRFLKQSLATAALVMASWHAFGQGLNVVQTQTPGVIPNLTSGSSNIQDDVCDAVNPATTVAPTATAHYLRDADSSGNATCGQFVLNTDPGARFSSSPEYFTNPFPGTNDVAFPANSAKAVGIVIPQTIRTGSVDINVRVPDTNSANYDIGFINASGIVICHTGPQTSPYGSTGAKTLTWSSPCTLYAGKYYLAMTSSCTTGCAAIQGGLTTPLLQTFFSGSIGSTPPGTLNNITPPTDALATVSIPSVWVH